VNPHKFWRKGKFGDFDESKKLQLTLSLLSDLTKVQKIGGLGRGKKKKQAKGTTGKQEATTHAELFLFFHPQNEVSERSETANKNGVFFPLSRTKQWGPFTRIVEESNFCLHSVTQTPKSVCV
jgi:hypothetical protein